MQGTLKQNVCVRVCIQGMPIKSSPLEYLADNSSVVYGCMQLCVQQCLHANDSEETMAT